MKKTRSIIAFFSLIICLICTIPTFGKYYGGSTGVLWESTFNEFTTVATEFRITNKDGETSNNLWGLGYNKTNPEEGTNHVGTITNGNDYLMNNLGGVKFSSYNASGERMLITFSVYFYIGGLNSTLGFTLKNLSSTDSANDITGTVSAGKNTTTSELFEIEKTGYVAEITGNGLAVFLASLANQGSTSYVQYKVTINPETYFLKKETNGEGANVISAEERSIFETYFVLNNNQKKDFNISSTYDNVLGDLAVFNSYSSIEMKAIPYNA